MKAKIISFFSVLMAAVVCSGCSNAENNSTFNSNFSAAVESSSTVVIDTSIQETDDWKFQYDEKAGGIIIKECLCANKKSDDLLKSKDADIVVPTSFAGFEGIKVVEIGEEAFYNRIMKSLTLPNTVVSIGSKAFSNAEISDELVIPESVTSIGEEAFSYSDIKSVVLPPMEAIGSRIFYKSNVEKVVMTEGTRVITNSAFSGCSKLRELVIPDSVEEIDRGGLDFSIDASNLDEPNFTLRLPNSLKKMDIKELPQYVVKVKIGSEYMNSSFYPKIIFKEKTYDFISSLGSNEYKLLSQELQAAIDNNT